MSAVAKRDPLDDGQPFFAEANLGQADIGDWLSTCDIEHVWAEYETAGMGAELVRICWSENRADCQSFLADRARQLIKPVRAIRKAVQEWSKPSTENE